MGILVSKKRKSKLSRSRDNLQSSHHEENVADEQEDIVASSPEEMNEETMEIKSDQEEQSNDSNSDNDDNDDNNDDNDSGNDIDNDVEDDTSNEQLEERKEETQLKYSSDEVDDVLLPLPELIEALLNGKIEIEVPSQVHIVRIFTSSTFTDTFHERNSLMLKVYPKLKEYCQSKGFDFQVVDMRWGVRDEATADHMTSELCMRELKACQKLSTGPNFITFLAQKYGYRPFPPKIEADEFEKLSKHMSSNSEDVELFNKWFLKDVNIVPPMYVLQPITDILPNYNNQDVSKEERWAASNEWWTAFERMQVVLREASSKCLNENERWKYFMSVTEDEISRGILKAKNPDKHCYWFKREINDVYNNYEDGKARNFVDKLGNKLDSEANKLVSELKSKKIPDFLKTSNVKTYSVQWYKDKGIDPKSSQEHALYIENLCRDFYNTLVDMINKGIEERKQQDIDDRLIQEISQHVETCKLKSKIFHGRVEELEQVKEYLHKESDELDDSPMVIHGPSGSGKTALMARIAKLTKEEYPDDLVVFRFLGTTGDSSSIFKVLQSVCNQIIRVHEGSMDKAGPMPKTFKALFEYFGNLLSNAHEHCLKIFIILDSIDQLSTDDGAHVMKWVPKHFGSNIKIIISTLPDEKYGILTNLQGFLPTGIFVDVPKIPDDIASDIFNAWLKDSRHKLTSEQHSLVMNAFRKCPLPLFLKLSFDESMRWKSYTPVSELVLNDNIKEAIESLFTRLERLHGVLLVQHSLGLITASKHGLSDAELDEILSIDDEVLNDVYQYWTPPVRKIPPLLWIRIRTDLGSYMVTRGASGVLVNNWYHRQFIEAATEKYLQQEHKLTYHKLLAEYFLGTWTDGKKKPYVTKSGEKLEADRLLSSQPNIYSGKGEEEIFNFRRLSELPRHLIIVGDADQVKREIFYNFHFLLAKLKAFGYQYLFEDLSEARSKFPKDKDIKLIHEFFKMTARVLTAAPNQLSTQLIGRLINQSKSDYLKQLLQDAQQQGKQCFYPSQQCFDAPGGALVQVFSGHTQMINFISVTRDQKKLLSCSMDSTLKLWDLNDGSLLKSIDLESGANMAFPFQDDTCAVVCSYSNVTSLNLTTEEVYFNGFHGSGYGHTCSTSVDEKYLVVGNSEDFTSFNIEDKILKVIYTYKNKHKKDSSVQVYATDVVAGGRDHYSFTVGIPNIIIIRSFQDEKYEKKLKVAASFMFFKYTPDGEKLCVLATPSSMMDSNKIVKVFIYSSHDYSLLKEFKSADNHMIVQVYSAYFYETDDGMELVWPTLSEVNFWNIDTGAQKKALKSGYQGVQHKQGIVCDGVLIMTRLDQNTTSIQAYDMDAITFVHVDANAPAKTDVDIAREWVGKGDRDLHLDPLDHSMAYSIPAMDPKISVWDVSEQKLLKEVDLQGLFPSAVKAIGKKTLLIWDHNDRTVLVYDIEASTAKSKIKGMCDIPPSIYYNTWVYVKDKQLVVVMDKAKKFFKVYKETGEFVGDISTKFKGEVQHLLVSENGERIVASQRYEGKGGKENPALIIDTVDRKILCQINMGESFVMNNATNSFTADGNYYVYPSQDSQQIVVWNVETNKKEKEITYVVNEDLKGTVIALKISSKQKYLATCYQSYLFVGETYEACYILVAYSFDWKKKYEVIMPGMAMQMMTSSDEKRLLASIQADENQLKAFALYDFSQFLNTGKFDVLAQLRIDVETRFCYLAQDGLKLCIGLADYTGITFMKMCGGDEQDEKSDEPVKEPVKDLRNLVI